jgi:hypothetical protein
MNAQKNAIFSHSSHSSHSDWLATRIRKKRVVIWGEYIRGSEAVTVTAMTAMTAGMNAQKNAVSARFVHSVHSVHGAQLPTRIEKRVRHNRHCILYIRSGLCTVHTAHAMNGKENAQKNAVSARFVHSVHSVHGGQLTTRIEKRGRHNRHCILYIRSGLSTVDTVHAMNGKENAR